MPMAARVNFENTIIVMTSNAGSDKQDGGTVGFGTQRQTSRTRTRP